MDWKQVLTVLGVTTAMFTWAVSESRADHREVVALARSISEEVKEFHQEMREIHGRVAYMEAHRQF